MNNLKNEGLSNKTYFTGDLMYDAVIRNLPIAEQKSNILSKLNLNVKDRNLKFEYGFEEADEQLSINLDFKFKDGVVNTEYDEDQTRDMIQNIFFNDKERI